MSFYTAYTLFNEGSDPGNASDPDASTIGGGAETSFMHHWAVTWCPSGQTLTPVTGTYTPSLGTPGPIEPMTLVTSSSAGGFTVQIWNRTGSDANGSDPVYFQWSHSHTIAAPPGSGVNITDYVGVVGVTFSGVEDGFVYAYTPLTGVASPQDFPSVTLPANTVSFDLGFAVFVDADITATDTHSGLFDFAGPVGSSPVSQGVAGLFTGIPSTDVALGPGSESPGLLPAPGVGGYTIDGYSVDGPAVTWGQAFLFVVAGYVLGASPTGWRVGRVGAGNTPW